MKRYSVDVECYDIHRLVVEAENADQAEELAYDMDLGPETLISASAEVTEVTEVEETNDETDDSGSGERPEDEGEIS